MGSGRKTFAFYFHFRPGIRLLPVFLSFQVKMVLTFLNDFLKIICVTHENYMQIKFQHT